MSVTRRARLLVDVDNPRLVWLMSLSHGFNEFFSIIIPPLFPFLVPDLGISYADASLLVVTFFVTYSVFQLPVGRLVDVYSPRMLLAVGMVVLSVGIAVVALAPTFSTILVGMVVAGVGGSTYHPTGMSVISDVESGETHGRSMGIHGMMGTLGSVTAPIILTAVAVAADWRTALLVGSALGFVFGAILFVAYPRANPRAGPETDFLTAVRAEFGDGSLGGLTARLGEFLRSPTMVGLVLLFAVVGGEVRAVQSFTGVFASQAVGDDPAFGNAMLSVTMVAAAIASTMAGYGVDRWNRRRFAAACFLLTAAAVAGLVFLPLGRYLLPVGFVVLGVVMYSIYPAANAITAGATTEDQSGSVFAVTQTAAALGGASGPFVLGVVSDAFGLRYGFLTTAGIALVGAAVVVVAGGIMEE
ncbi:MAG: MFS transporter [Haloplanus sp.]